MTKREMQWVAAYNDSTATELRDVYSSYSRDKEMAFRHCNDAMKLEGGSNLRIISANTFHFTVAWLMPNHRLHVTTRDNDYIIDLSQLPF